MIKIKHPIEKYNKNQEEMLANCPESQRRFQELFFSYGNATYLYHQKSQVFEPTLTDYQDWLDGLPDSIRKDMKEKGFESCKSVLSFTRYINETNDIGMDEFVESLMGDEYQEYKKLVNPD